MAQQSPVGCPPPVYATCEFPLAPVPHRGSTTQEGVCIMMENMESRRQSMFLHGRREEPIQ